MGTHVMATLAAGLSLRLVKGTEIWASCGLRGLAMSCHQGAQEENISEFLQNVPHRKHPGILNMKKVSLPAEVLQASKLLMKNSEISHFEERVKDLTNYLWSRKRPVEDRELQRYATEVEKMLRPKMEAHFNPAQQSTESEEDLERTLKRKVMETLRKKIYHWQQLRYDKDLSVLYLAARFGGGYAAVTRAFHEIRKRVPDFTPRTLLDFGSGTGSVTWAAHATWAKNIQEYMCVDCSAEMNELAEQVMKAGSTSQERIIPGVHFRQFLPVSPKVKYDLVVSAYSLTELSSQQERIETIQTLWRKTDNFLVLVENGTKEGHQILMEARDYILHHDQDRLNSKGSAGHVFAPCPHELSCPLLSKKDSVPCNFIQVYQPLPFRWNPSSNWERFSFLIMRRGLETNLQRWPRLTLPVQQRPRHVHCHMCCSDGSVQHVVFTAHKHGRDLYRCARHSDWGDCLPMTMPRPVMDKTVPDERDKESTVPTSDTIPES